MRGSYSMLEDESSKDLPAEWLVVDEKCLGVLTSTLSLREAWQYAEALGGTMTVMSKREYDEKLQKFREAWDKISPKID